MKDMGQEWGNWNLNPRQILTLYRKSAITSMRYSSPSIAEVVITATHTSVDDDLLPNMQGSACSE